MPSDQNQASRQFRQLLDDRGQVQIVYQGNLIWNHAERDGNRVLLIMSIDAEPVPVVDRGRKIKVLVRFELLESVGSHHGEHHLLGVLVADSGEVHNDQFRILSQNRRHAHIYMHVAGLLLYRLCQYSLDIFHLKISLLTKGIV